MRLLLLKITDDDSCLHTSQRQLGIATVVTALLCLLAGTVALFGSDWRLPLLSALEGSQSTETVPSEQCSLQQC